MKNKCLHSQTILKIAALLFMTLDHLGIFLGYFILGNDSGLVYIFRLLGKIALPLICIITAESIRHSKSKLKYILRLTICALIISISLIIFKNVSVIANDVMGSIGNIFLTLLLSSLFIYLIEKKNKLSFLAILPFAVILISCITTNYEFANSAIVYWFPYYLRCQYDLYAFTLIVGIYFATPLAKAYLSKMEKAQSLQEGFYQDTKYERNLINILYGTVILITTLVYLAIYLNANIFMAEGQMGAIFSIIFLIGYDHTRGYNKKWFKYGCYIYYPTHIIILAIIFMLIIR